MSGNPVLNDRRFMTIAHSVPAEGVMTIEGALRKASILFGALLLGMLLMFGAYAALDASTAGSGLALASVTTMVGGIGAFILVIARAQHHDASTQRRRRFIHRSRATRRARARRDARDADARDVRHRRRSHERHRRPRAVVGAECRVR